MPPSPVTSSSPPSPAVAADQARVSAATSADRPARAGPRSGTGQPGRRGRRLGQHREVHVAGLRGRVDAQLVGQRGAQPLVDGQRSGRLPRRLVRGHQQPVRGLVEPVRADRRGRELRGGDRVGGVQQRLPGRLPGGAQQRGMLGAHVEHPVRLRLTGQRRAVAEQVTGHAPGRGGQSRVGPRTALRDQACRLVQVHVDRRWAAEPVALRNLLHGLRTEGGPQPADQGRDRARRTVRGTARPHRLDDALHRNRTTPAGGQQREQHPRLAAAHLHIGLRAAAAQHPDRPGQPDGRTVHPARIVPAPSYPGSSTGSACRNKPL